MQSIDVQTGRFLKYGAGSGARLKAHRGQKAWWVVTASVCASAEYADGHTHEVCLHNIGPHHSSPTWPILALFSGADAAAWTKKLCAFAKTIPAEGDFFDPEVNGDRRLAAWLKANGFVRYNHIWWTLPKAAPSAQE